MNAENLDDEGTVLEVLNLSEASLEIIYQFIYTENLSAIHTITKLLDLVSADIIGPFYLHFKSLLQFKTTSTYIRDKMGQDIDVIQAALTPFHFFRKIFEIDSTFVDISHDILVDKMSLEGTYEMLDHIVTEHRKVNASPPLFRIYEEQLFLYSSLPRNPNIPDRRHMFNRVSLEVRHDFLEKYRTILKKRSKTEKMRIKVKGISSYLANTGNRIIYKVLSLSVMKAMGAIEGRREDGEGQVVVVQLSLATLPPHILESIFYLLSFENLASIRGVCREFDASVSYILNKEFNKFRKTVQERVESLSEQFNSNLSEYITISVAVELDILIVIELSLACLHYALGRYLEKNHGCFFPGKILDQCHELMQKATDNSSDFKDPKLEDLIQSSYKAILFFKQNIEPKFGANDSSLNYAFYEFKNRMKLLFRR